MKAQLIAAKALIDTPEKWIQGNAAEDAKGNQISPHDVAAVRFCSVGALGHVFSDDEYGDAVDYLKSHLGGYGFVAEFNDTHTHAEVMAAWDRAIEAAP